VNSWERRGTAGCRSSCSRSSCSGEVEDPPCVSLEVELPGLVIEFETVEVLERALRAERAR
jgi:hypothetical protein